VDRPPDLVLLLVDTLRRDHVSAYGADIETPNMQRLADAGQVFSNVQASFHQTTMSMGALFTGHTPSIESGAVEETLSWDGRHWCGLSRFAEDDRDGCVPRGLTTLAESLRDAGYWTAGVVANRLLFSPAGYEQGFDSWSEVGTKDASLPQAIRVAARSAEEVNETLARVLERRPEGPVFLYVHFLDVHDYRPNGLPYARGVERFDVELGRTLEILDSAGLGDDRVTFLVSDHGENLGERHGNRSYKRHFGNPSFQPLLDIPLIVSPAIDPDPDRFLRSQDLADLIRAVAGLETPLAGVSGPLAPDEILISESFYLTYRRGRYKVALPRGPSGHRRLWDLEHDPGETSNRIGLEPELADRLLSRARALAETLAHEGSSAGVRREEDEARLRALGYLE
jgi:arylsulfatase A-like enzyme